MKNYYDELEVSKTASKEVIEKAYKVLAKKYHPDTTNEPNKKTAEEKFKIISEAYEILSNDEKRKQYDLELEQNNPTISYEEYMDVVNQRDTLNNNLRNSQYNQNHYTQKQSTQTNPNINNRYSNNQYSNTNSNKKTYYYTDTGKPASAFDYYRYKIKTFFSNIAFYVLLIFLIILIIRNIFTTGLYSLFF